MKQLGSSLPYVLRCKMLVSGKNWTTEFTLISKYTSKVWNKMEQGSRHNIAEVDQGPKTRGDTVMRVIVMKIANLVCSSMLHLQVTCETPNQRQEVYCARSDHKRLFQFSWMRKRQSAAFHSSAESEIISLDAGLWMDGYQRFNFGNVCVGSVSSKPAWALQTRKSHFRLIHIGTFVFFWVNWPCSAQHSQQFSVNNAEWSKRSIKDEAKILGTSRERTESI